MNFDEIESNEFSALANLASGFHTFYRIITQHEKVKMLYEEDLDNISSRLEQVLLREFDKKYENPWDAAIAIYLIILNERKYSEIDSLCMKIMNADHLFWAKRVVEKIYEY